ncbi:hypothetical protein NDU88_000371 [Pleurodeles waltl]|uniref:Ig-like domain-containing protein n=1 Tax=Pleurodeles waltl TaxID=8319 RepID=A0AAV7P0N0_PLEWA|nr:hypothetical protein NDU88_000371 [Pleurodeles waltl]
MARVWSLAALLCLIKWSDATVHQSPYEVRRSGQKAELQCDQDEAHPYMFWYRQTPGTGLQLVFYSLGADLVEQENKTWASFSASRPSTNTFELKISDLQPRDSAVYFCASSLAQRCKVM